MFVSMKSRDELREMFKNEVYEEIASEVRANVLKEVEIKKTADREKMDEITRILFPAIVLQTDDQGKKYHIDYAADSNLQAILSDLTEGYSDQVVQSGVAKVADRLYAVRKLLGIENEMDPEAVYFIIDHPKQNKVDEIIASI